MAVYTVLNQAEIQAFLADYSLGSLEAINPVADGIENTNYFLTTNQAQGGAEFLLTLYEHQLAAELDIYLDWLDELDRHQLPVAKAVPDKAGRRVQLLKNKPAVIFPKLPGVHPNFITPGHCASIGEVLAHLHELSLASDIQQQGPRNLNWFLALIENLKPRMTMADKHLMKKALESQGRAFHTDLPKGMVHGDLFPDNTLFEGSNLTGLVDFFSGGTAPLVYDLAVSINAWCSNEAGALCQRRFQSFVDAYIGRRSPTARELQSLQDALIFAASRFWLSRLADQTPRSDALSPGALVQQKDPAEYRAILEDRLQRPSFAKLV